MAYISLYNSNVGKYVWLHRFSSWLLWEPPCTYTTLTLHNELTCGKNSNFKYVFGWLHDYLKDLNQRFSKNFLLSSSPLETLQQPPLKFFSKNIDFSCLWGKQYVHFPAKMEFFPSFRSLYLCAILLEISHARLLPLYDPNV